MLAADKLQLQSALKQQATALKEKEFNLHHSNLMTVGTQAAVLAGLDITMFIEFTPSSVEEWPLPLVPIHRLLKIVYYTIIVAAFCSNMIVVSQTTILSVLGAGLALRGPDGSMMIATDALYDERKTVFMIFGVGLACTVGSVLISVWLMLPVEAATLCFIVAVITCYVIYANYRRVSYRLDYDESQTVDFREFMSLGSPLFFSGGVAPGNNSSNRNSNTNSNKNKSKKISISNNKTSRKSGVGGTSRPMVDDEYYNDETRGMLYSSGDNNTNSEGHYFSNDESDGSGDIEQQQQQQYYASKNNISNNRNRRRNYNHSHSTSSSNGNQQQQQQQQQRQRGSGGGMERANSSTSAGRRYHHDPEPMQTV